MSPKLGFSLDRIVINPVAVYEDLPKDEVKEQINLRPKKKGLPSYYVLFEAGSFLGV